jgi:hypothetical protein
MRAIPSSKFRANLRIGQVNPACQGAFRALESRCMAGMIGVYSLYVWHVACFTVCRMKNKNTIETIKLGALVRTRQGIGRVIDVNSQLVAGEDEKPDRDVVHCLVKFDNGAKSRWYPVAKIKALSPLDKDY